MEIKDSGNRREFSTGAVRDVADGKGRCDLLPLVTIGEMTNDRILVAIGRYVYSGNREYIYEAIRRFSEQRYHTMYEAMLEVAKHFENGANKYAERNWEIGIPMHCYIDSGVRHYFKFMRGDTDEPHCNSFLWNMLCLLWTHDNKPEMNDLPFAEVQE